MIIKELKGIPEQEDFPGDPVLSLSKNSLERLNDFHKKDPWPRKNGRDQD